MLNISLEKIYRLIELAELRLQYVKSKEEKSKGYRGSISDDLAKSVLANLGKGRSNEEIQLRRYLDELSKEELSEVIALMYFGRGSAGSFSSLLERFKPHEGLNSNLAYEKLELASYLRDGLKQLGKE